MSAWRFMRARRVLFSLVLLSVAIFLLSGSVSLRLSSLTVGNKSPRKNTETSAEGPHVRGIQSTTLRGKHNPGDTENEAGGVLNKKVDLQEQSADGPRGQWMGEGVGEQERGGSRRGDTGGKLRGGPVGAGAGARGDPTIGAAKEPIYTWEYRRVTESNYSSVFWYDSQGEGHVREEARRSRPNASAALIASAPELFDKVPTSFLGNFKNPCWVRGNSELNCLPYFYIIGMFKCATTDIWDKLVYHPDVVKVPKEPHWWGPRRHGWLKTPIDVEALFYARANTGGSDDSSLEWYLNLYKHTVVPHLVANTDVDEEGNTYHPKVFGDASISTAFSLGQEWIKDHPSALEPPFTNADLIHALQPQAKIVLMVRNPTKRAISWWWFSHGPGSKKVPYTPETLHEQMVGHIDCFNTCLAAHPLRYCAYASGCPYNLIPNLQVGIYHVFLEDWIKAYSRDQILVIRVEDWQANQRTVYRQLLDFLDLSSMPVELEDKALQRAMRNTLTKTHEDVLPETERLLDDFYRPYNLKMAALMGDDKFLYL